MLLHGQTIKDQFSNFSILISKNILTQTKKKNNNNKKERKKERKKKKKKKIKPKESYHKHILVTRS
jgi:hypothetical protein